MNKVLLIAAVMLSAIGYSHADSLDVPQGKGNPLATADFSGVERSTVAYTTGSVLCFTGPGSVVGFIWSSTASETTNLVFRDTTTLRSGSSSGGGPGVAADDYNTDRQFAQVYLSTVTLSVDPNLGFIWLAKTGGSYLFPKPIRVYSGLAVKPNERLPMITILWTRFSR